MSWPDRAENLSQDEYVRLLRLVSNLRTENRRLQNHKKLSEKLMQRIKNARHALDGRRDIQTPD